MGCIYFKSRSRQQPDSRELIPEKKEYSWDKRPKLNPKDFTVENLTDCCTSVRSPGSVAGKQFIIQNCKDAFIYVLDHCSTITVDDCSNCKIVLGPTKGSVFVRSCEDCVLVALCGQFRARDCHKLTTYLLCPSQPAIESCSKIRVGCCSLSYTGLREQLVQAGLSQFNNQWNLVYDFTPVPSEGANWRTITTSEQLEVLNTPPSDTETLTTLDFIVGDVLRSDVPLTSGSRSGSNDDCCLAVILPSSQQLQHAMDFIAAMTNLDGRFELVETRERSINANEAKQFLHGIATIPASETPLQLVGLHFRGPGCVEKCQQVVAHLSLSPDCSGQMFVSPTSEVARKQIQNFMAATDHC